MPASVLDLIDNQRMSIKNTAKPDGAWRCFFSVRTIVHATGI